MRYFLFQQRHYPTRGVYLVHEVERRPDLLIGVARTLNTYDWLSEDIVFSFASKSDRPRPSKKRAVCGLVARDILEQAMPYRYYEAADMTARFGSIPARCHIVAYGLCIDLVLEQWDEGRRFIGVRP